MTTPTPTPPPAPSRGDGVRPEVIEAAQLVVRQLTVERDAARLRVKELEGEAAKQSHEKDGWHKVVKDVDAALLSAAKDGDIVLRKSIPETVFAVLARLQAAEARVKELEGELSRLTAIERSYNAQRNLPSDQRTIPDDDAGRAAYWKGRAKSIEGDFAKLSDALLKEGEAKDKAEAEAVRLRDEVEQLRALWKCQTDGNVELLTELNKTQRELRAQRPDPAAVARVVEGLKEAEGDFDEYGECRIERKIITEAVALLEGWM